MRGLDVLFACSERIQNGEARFWAPVARAWRDEPTPRMKAATLRSMVNLLEQSRAGQPIAGVAVVVITDADGVDLADRCVEALSARGMPAVILAEHEGRWKPLETPGILVQQWSQRPEIIAAMALALGSRQGYVEALSRELSLVMRCHAGVRGEIERLHEELHLAAGIQQEFTGAPLPRVPGVEFGVLFRPVNMVSGDIYSVRDLGNGKVSFFIADAVGHGVPAALLTMVLTNTLMSIEQSPGARDEDPARVMERLNHRLVEGTLNTGRFATAVYGIIDANTGSARIANAGHPHPGVISATGSRRVETDGPLMGVFADATFESVGVSLAPGETLVLYTDGMETAFPKPGGVAPRREHLRLIDKIFRESSEGPCIDALRVLEDLLDEQTGSLHQTDDVTALAVRRTREAGVMREAA